MVAYILFCCIMSITVRTISKSKLYIEMYYQTRKGKKTQFKDGQSFCFTVLSVCFQCAFTVFQVSQTRNLKSLLGAIYLLVKQQQDTVKNEFQLYSHLKSFLSPSKNRTVSSLEKRGICLANGKQLAFSLFLINRTSILFQETAHPQPQGMNHN